MKTRHKALANKHHQGTPARTSGEISRHGSPAFQAARRLLNRLAKRRDHRLALREETPS